MALISGIHHICMECCTPEEYEKTVGFYRDVLGLSVKRTWPVGTMLDAGNCIVEIFSNGKAPLPKGTLRHYAFQVADTDACVEAVRNAGYEVFKGPRDIVMASDPPFPARIAFCYGPLGEEIEFLQEK